MTTFITCFVAIQLILGFCALLSAMRHAPVGVEDATGFHQVRARRETRPVNLRRTNREAASALHLGNQLAGGCSH